MGWVAAGGVAQALPGWYCQAGISAGYSHGGVPPGALDAMSSSTLIWSAGSFLTFLAFLGGRTGFTKPALLTIGKDRSIAVDARQKAMVEQRAARMSGDLGCVTKIQLILACFNHLLS